MNTDSFSFQGGLVDFSSTIISYEPLGTFAPGRRHLILGKNGSGKSTLLRCLSGVIPQVYSAHVKLKFFLGETPFSRDSFFTGESFLAFLPQDTQEFLLGFSVSEECECSVKFSHNFSPRLFEKITTMSRIGELADRPSSELSDGEKQRVAITCALLYCPKWLVLDEWASHLDNNWVSTFQELLNSLVNDGILSTLELASVNREGLEQPRSIISRITKNTPDFKSYDLKERFQALSQLLHAMDGVLDNSCPGCLFYSGNLRITDPLMHLQPFEIPSGTIGLVLGPNGSGKTTLLKNVRAQSGVRKNQKLALVLSNPILQILGRSIHSMLCSYFRNTPEKNLSKFTELISVVLNIPVDSDPLELNAASRKLLALLIASFAKTPALAVDEPFNGLDGDSKFLAERIIRFAAQTRRLSVLVSSPTDSCILEDIDSPIKQIRLQSS